MTEASMELTETETAEDNAFARCLAAGKAIELVKSELESDLKAAKARWRDKLSDATKAYREILRDEDVTDSTPQRRCKELFFEVRELLAEHDEILDDAKRDKDLRKQRIAKFEVAARELWSISSAQPEQLELHGRTDTILGLGWATKESREIVYSALMRLTARDTFDVTFAGPVPGLAEAARGLLADMAGAGLGTIELGLDAEDAIEHDVDEDDLPDADEDEDDAELPF